MTEANLAATSEASSWIMSASDTLWRQFTSKSRHRIGTLPNCEEEGSMTSLWAGNMEEEEEERVFDAQSSNMLQDSLQFPCSQPWARCSLPSLLFLEPLSYVTLLHLVPKVSWSSESSLPSLPIWSVSCSSCPGLSPSSTQRGTSCHQLPIIASIIYYCMPAKCLVSSWHGLRTAATVPCFNFGSPASCKLI